MAYRSELLESQGIDWVQTRYEVTHGKLGDAVALWATELRDKRERREGIRFHAIFWEAVATLVVAATLYVTLNPNRAIPNFFEDISGR